MYAINKFSSEVKAHSVRSMSDLLDQLRNRAMFDESYDGFDSEVARFTDIHEAKAALDQLRNHCYVLADGCCARGTFYNLVEVEYDESDFPEYGEIIALAQDEEAE